MAEGGEGEQDDVSFLRTVSTLKSGKNKKSHDGHAIKMVAQSLRASKKSEKKSRIFF